MKYAGLEALAGRNGTSPAKASSPAYLIHQLYFIFILLVLYLIVFTPSLWSAIRIIARGGAIILIALQMIGTVLEEFYYT
jgi:hypothetical protein